MNHGNAQKLMPVTKIAGGERASECPELLALRRHGRLRICAWCRRIPVRQDQWVDSDAVLDGLKSLSRELLAQATHGVCPDCFAAFVAGKQTGNACFATGEVGRLAAA